MEGLTIMIRCRQNITLESILKDFDKLLTRVGSFPAMSSATGVAKYQSIHNLNEARKDFKIVARGEEVVHVVDKRRPAKRYDVDETED